jgi:hypothetical protein
MCSEDIISTTNNEFLSINDTEEIQRRINEMKSNLKVPFNSTSQHMRRKICAEDERVSSRAIGTVLGAGLISLVAAFILFSDIVGVIVFLFQLIAAICKRNIVDKTSDLKIK